VSIVRGIGSFVCLLICLFLYLLRGEDEDEDEIVLYDVVVGFWFAECRESEGERGVPIVELVAVALGFAFFGDRFESRS
jgi:hypothetical protein